MSRFSPLLSTLLAVCFLSTPAFALKVDKGQVILDKLDDYNLCQAHDYSGDWCHDALIRWVDDHPADAFKAGKMTRLKMNHWVALTFFARAFDHQQGDCKDEDVRLAIISGLNLPADSNKEAVEQARKIAFQTCFPELKDALVEEAKLDSYLFKNACKDLDSKGALAGLKKKKCAATESK